MMMQRLKNKTLRPKIITEMKKRKFDFSKVEIAISPLGKTLARRKITEIASSQEKSVYEAIIDVLVASEGRVITTADVLSEANVKKELAHPLSIISTNGAGYSVGHKATGEMVHPRCFGAMTRVLETYVRKEKLLTWETTIKKMTGLPAYIFGINQRGIID